MASHLAKEIRAAIADYMKANPRATYAETGRLFGVTRQAVGRIAGKGYRFKHQRADDKHTERARQVAQMHADGVPKAAIARQFGVHPSKVYDILTRTGLEETVAPEAIRLTAAAIVARETYRIETARRAVAEPYRRAMAEALEEFQHWEAMQAARPKRIQCGARA